MQKAVLYKTLDIFLVAILNLGKKDPNAEHSFFVLREVFQSLFPYHYPGTFNLVEFLPVLAGNRGHMHNNPKLSHELRVFIYQAVCTVRADILGFRNQFGISRGDL